MKVPSPEGQLNSGMPECAPGLLLLVMRKMRMTVYSQCRAGIFAAFGSARLARGGRGSTFASLCPIHRKHVRNPAALGSTYPARRGGRTKKGFWSHGDQKRRRFAMKSPCGRWHASVYRKQSSGLFSVKRRSATNYNFMAHTQADLCHWPVPNSECLARE